MMTAQAREMDPLARLGRQIVVAAERRAVRRHRRRVALVVSTATLALGVVAGVGALQTDYVGPIPSPAFPEFRQYANARIDLQVREGLDTTWRVTVYRSLKGGICTASPTDTTVAPQVICRSAFITAGELKTDPLEPHAGVILQSNPDGDAVLVSGLAREDVESIVLQPVSGADVERPIEGSLLEVPIVDLRTDKLTDETLKVRPFAVMFTLPTGSKEMHLLVHTSDGATSPLDLNVVPIEKTR